VASELASEEPEKLKAAAEEGIGQEEAKSPW
jgi:hypothetical protein